MNAVDFYNNWKEIKNIPDRIGYNRSKTGGERSKRSDNAFISIKITDAAKEIIENIDIKYRRIDYLNQALSRGFDRIKEKIGIEDTDKITPNAKPALFKGSGKPNMWVVPIKAQGGFLEGYGDNVLMAQNLEKVYFPFIGQECFAFEIDGLSMITDYLPGEYFVGTPIENFNHLVKGRVYVFQTIDGIILKEFVKIEEDYIYLRSQNEDYNPVKPIYLKEIKRVYQREMVIKN